MAKRTPASAGDVGACAQKETRHVIDESHGRHSGETAVSGVGARRSLVDDVTHGVVRVVPGGRVSRVGRVAAGRDGCRRAGPDQLAEIVVGEGRPDVGRAIGRSAGDVVGRRGDGVAHSVVVDVRRDALGVRGVRAAAQGVICVSGGQIGVRGVGRPAGLSGDGDRAQATHDVVGAGGQELGIAGVPGGSQ